MSQKTTTKPSRVGYTNQKKTITIGSITLIFLIHSVISPYLNI